jgi:ribosomal protein L11
MSDVVKVQVNPGETPPNPPATPNPDQKVKPEYVPDKFWDAEKGEVRLEDFAKSYGELERKFSSKPADPPPAKPGETPPAKPGENPPATPTGDDPAQKAVESAGLNFEQLVEEFNATGKLSENAYKAFEKIGIPKNMVDGYIEGQVALNEQRNQTVFSWVGGQDKYTEMVTWAKANLKPEEIQAYDKIVSGRDMQQISLAVQGLHNLFTKANGTEGNLLSFNNNGSNTGAKFDSVEQLKAAIRNPRYKTDEAYRKEVQAKIMNSSVI